MWEKFTNWLASWWEAIKDFFKAFLNTYLDMLKDFYYWIFETVIDIALTFFDQIVDGESWDLSQYITALPPEILQGLGALGFGNCMAVIGFALLVRFLMGLVPFIRLGR